VRPRAFFAGKGGERSLPDEAIAKIGIEREVVSAEEGGPLQVAAWGKMPDIVEGKLAGVGLVLLARVNRVLQIGSVDRDQTRNFRLAVVTNEQQRQLIRAEVPPFQRVDLVLAAMLGGSEEPISVRGLHGEPFPAGAEVDV